MGKRLPSAPTRQQTLTEHEAKRLLHAARDTRLGTFVTLGVYTGARRAELLGATWSCLDLDRGRWTIAQALTSDGILAEPKCKRSCRTVILPPDAIAALRTHKAAQAEVRLGKGSLYDDQGFVFSDELGRPWKLDSQATLFRAIAKRAGLGPNVHIHTMRHSFASLALARGVPITTLAATLGHDTSVLMKVYGHALPSAEDSAAKALQQALAGASH